MSRNFHLLWNGGIAILLCVAAVGEFRTASADTKFLHPASAAQLHATLGKYLTIESQGGWPMMRDGPALRIGSVGPSVVRLKKRLLATNDLTSQSSNPSEFGKDLFAAVIRFQTRHGLVPDGVVGRMTRAALNVSAGARVQQIIANLARLQSLPPADGERMILINVAGFDLNVIENGKIAFSSPVIVGRLSRPTPVLSSTVTTIVVNPYWRIPRRIATEDILPKLKRDPSYLSEQAIRIFKTSGGSLEEVKRESVAWRSLNAGNFPYLLVQDPGPLNPLGRVKFFLPNEQDIFVHDTPARGLFEHSLRAFSSGCIRVRRAVELARFLLERDSKTSLHAMAEALRNGKTRRIALTDAIPIHIVYLTAWADADGRAHFRKDIYALDRPADAEHARRRELYRDVARANDVAPAPNCPTNSPPPRVLH